MWLKSFSTKIKLNVNNQILNIYISNSNLTINTDKKKLAISAVTAAGIVCLVFFIPIEPK